MKNNRGFSLVEVILVICLLGLLGAIAVPNITGISRSSSIKSDKTLGARIGNAFVTRELDGYKIDVGKQEKYSTVSNIAPYIPTNIKPDVLDGGYYVVTKVQYEGRPVILVGITNGTDLIGKKDIYDGKKSGWVWSSYSDIEDFLKGNLGWTQETVTYNCKCCGTPITTAGYCGICNGKEKCKSSSCNKCDFHRILCDECGKCESYCCAGHSVSTYIIKYNANGGSGNMASQEVTAGEKAKLLYNGFVNDGYTFRCWSKDAVATTTYAENQEIRLTENMELYAIWDKNPTVTYTITYDVNGGTGSVESQTVTAGESVTLRTNGFSKSEYIFQGWYTAPSGGSNVTSPYTPTANITLYAQWKKCTHDMEKLGCNGCSAEGCWICNYSTGICICEGDFCNICGVCEEHHSDEPCSSGGNGGIECSHDEYAVIYDGPISCGNPANICLSAASGELRECKSCNKALWYVLTSCTCGLVQPGWL